MKELLLLTHPVVGVLGIFSTLWLCVELLNHNSKNLKRIRFASLSIPFFMFLTWIASGFWYVRYYAVDKAVILKGPWPFAHKVIMETKEHVFFVTLVLSFVIPFVVLKDNIENKRVRSILYMLCAFVILTAMALEAGGSLIAMGVKLGLLQSLNQ